MSVSLDENIHRGLHMEVHSRNRGVSEDGAAGHKGQTLPRQSMIQFDSHERFSRRCPLIVIIESAAKDPGLDRRAVQSSRRD